MLPCTYNAYIFILHLDSPFCLQFKQRISQLGCRFEVQIFCCLFHILLELFDRFLSFFLCHFLLLALRFLSVFLNINFSTD